MSCQTLELIKKSKKTNFWLYPLFSFFLYTLSYIIIPPAVLIISFIVSFSDFQQHVTSIYCCNTLFHSISCCYSSFFKNDAAVSVSFEKYFYICNVVQADSVLEGM